MAYQRIYPTKRNWENEPSQNTPINANNLNAMDNAIYNLDGQNIVWDTTKANQSDLLQCVKSITYNSSTGIFVFTWQNGSTLNVDLNIEKIPVSFTLSPEGILTMITADGTRFTADIGNLIKTYTFVDGNIIDFTTTQDGSGNKIIIADIKDGSITEDKLQPNFLAECKSARDEAVDAATEAGRSATRAEEAKLDAQAAKEAADADLEAITSAIGNTHFQVNFETGNLEYDDTYYTFTINTSTGDLEWEVAS